MNYKKIYGLFSTADTARYARRRKNLVINYEIHGSSGSLKGEEVEGHLKKTIDLR